MKMRKPKQRELKWTQLIYKATRQMSSRCFLLGGCRSYHFKDMGIVGWGLRAISLVVIFGVIWLSLVGILANHEMTTTRKVTVIPSTVSFKHWKLVGREKHHVHQDLEFFHYVSKRRVPNGPDPIHNRRVAKSRRPPGRV